MNFSSLAPRVDRYKSILNNTKKYRKAWNTKLKPMIKETLESFIKEFDLDADVDVDNRLENLEMIIFSLGRQKSGISELINDSDRKPVIRSNGMLTYQQLFNGKVVIWIGYPHLEGMGDPKPPKTLEILRPEELKEAFILRHLETLLVEVTNWEDYDDDVPKTIGFGNGIKPRVEDAESHDE